MSLLAGVRKRSDAHARAAAAATGATATDGAVAGGGNCLLVPSRTSCRGRFDDDRRKDDTADDALFGNEATKRADCSRRELRGDDATGSAENDELRASAVQSATTSTGREAWR